MCLPENPTGKKQKWDLRGCQRCGQCASSLPLQTNMSQIHTFFSNMINSFPLFLSRVLCSISSSIHTGPCRTSFCIKGKVKQDKSREYLWRQCYARMLTLMQKMLSNATVSTNGCDVIPKHNKNLIWGIIEWSGMPWRSAFVIFLWYPLSNALVDFSGVQKFKLSNTEMSEWQSFWQERTF